MSQLAELKKPSAIATCCIHAAMMLSVADRGEIDSKEKRAAILKANDGQAQLLLKCADMADGLLTALVDLRNDIAKLKWDQPYPGRNDALMDRVEAAIAEATGASE